MRKLDAVKMFGTVPDLARAIGVTPQAIYQWPDILAVAQTDRVVGAAVRLGKLQVRSDHESGDAGALSA